MSRLGRAARTAAGDLVLAGHERMAALAAIGPDSIVNTSAIVEHDCRCALLYDG